MAGTKDKRSISSQRITAYKLVVDKLLLINEHANNIRVGNFKLTKDHLRLGDLYGNNFKIVLRNIDINLKDNDILQSLNEIKKTGFINYFGMQRFGKNPNIPTHQVGIHILKKDWEKAISSILLSFITKDSQDYENLNKFLNREMKAHEILKVFPRFKVTEYNLLEGYKLNGRNAHTTVFERVINYLKLTI